jgi:predicted AlkP superfamily phosphohydrolase/phosphomutase
MTPSLLRLVRAGRELARRARGVPHLETLLAVALLLCAAPAAQMPGGRIIVIGFDGADGRTIENLMAERPGAYPNFERLARDGTFARLDSVAPAESPVSWAALNTGQNPAKTGVPGFVKRELKGRPLPGFGHLIQEERALAEFENTPIPAWSPAALGAALGGGVALFFLLLFIALLRLRPLLAILLALLLGAVGAWCGTSMRGLLAEEYPRSSNPNRARNFWDYLADAGVPAIVLDAAQAFDMPSGARVLAGLGLPDARGGIGDWCIYTTSDSVFEEVADGGRDTGTAGRLYRVHLRDGRVETRLFGPKNFWAEEKLTEKKQRLEEKLNDPGLDYATSVELNEKMRDLEAELAKVKKEGTSVPLTIEVDGAALRVALGAEEQTLAVGEWSAFYHLTFELNWLLKVHAITRVKLVQMEPHLELFVNVLDIDPEKPPFWQALSTPFAFSAELARENGPYETYGWPTATMPLKDEVVAPELFMEDVEFTTSWQERLTYSQLARDDWKLFMGVFSTTDRVQHMMYQYYDEGHPLHDAGEASKTFPFFGETITRKEAIPAIYKQMDRILGEIIEQHLGPEDTLLVCSDHGFQSFRYQVNVNNWLAQHGYLKLKSPLVAGRAGNNDLLQFVDWSGTQAYCVGLGFIYLNLKGREPQGIVEPAEADELLARIRADLLAYEDEATGLKVCKDAYVMKEIHAGPYLDQEADLLCGFAPTYRVSWNTTLGGLSVVTGPDGAGVPGPVITPSDKTWSGDHVSVALSEVQGVFFSNRRFAVPSQGFHALAIAPTAVSLAGVAVPSEMDMAPLKLQ